MAEVGIRALKQNASAVVAAAAAGEVITITEYGRPVARLTAIPQSPLQELLTSGRAQPAQRSITDLPEPKPGAPLAKVLEELRQDERY